MTLFISLSRASEEKGCVEGPGGIGVWGFSVERGQWNDETSQMRWEIHLRCQVRNGLDGMD